MLNLGSAMDVLFGCCLTTQHPEFSRTPTSPHSWVVSPRSETLPKVAGRLPLWRWVVYVAPVVPCCSNTVGMVFWREDALFKKPKPKKRWWTIRPIEMIYLYLFLLNFPDLFVYFYLLPSFRLCIYVSLFFYLSVYLPIYLSVCQFISLRIHTQNIMYYLEL